MLPPDRKLRWFLDAVPLTDRKLYFELSALSLVLISARSNQMLGCFYPNLPVIYSSVCFNWGLVKMVWVSLTSISFPR